MPQIIVDPLTMREFERTSPSVYWLLPNPQLFGDTPFVLANGRYLLFLLSIIVGSDFIDKLTSIFSYKCSDFMLFSLSS